MQTKPRRRNSSTTNQRSREAKKNPNRKYRLGFEPPGMKGPEIELRTKNDDVAGEKKINVISPSMHSRANIGDSKIKGS